jgi:hypothetical protein
LVAEAVSATYPTGESAIRALVDARTMTEAIKQLLARVTNLELRLNRAAGEADWQARNALTALDDFARSDPLQLGRHRSDECYDTLERGTERTHSLELQVAELLRDLDGDGS